MYDDDQESIYRDPIDQSIRNPAPFVLGRKRDPESETDAETIVDELEPQDVNMIDQDNYNPYRYCYKLILEELNMELVVKFEIETLDHTEKHPIQFIRDGVAYEIPFFPRVQEGVDPASTYGGPGDDYRFYRPDEHNYYIVPTVVRASVLGDGLDKAPVLVSKELVTQDVSPERLLSAIEDFRIEVINDSKAPVGLRDMLDDAVGYRDSWDEVSYGSGEDGWDESDNWDDD